MVFDRITSPQSSAGITRFDESAGSKVLIDPKVVVAFAVGVILLEAALHVMKF